MRGSADPAFQVCGFFPVCALLRRWVNSGGDVAAIFASRAAQAADLQKPCLVSRYPPTGSLSRSNRKMWIFFSSAIELPFGK